MDKKGRILREKCLETVRFSCAGDVHPLFGRFYLFPLESCRRKNVLNGIPIQHNGLQQISGRVWKSEMETLFFRG